MKRYLKLSFFFIARAIGLFAFSRFLTRSQLRILCYHGGCIGDEIKFNPKLFLHAKTLRSRMSWMKKIGFDIVPLDEATSMSSSQRKMLRATVTFDDGWYSTGATLLPVMAELQIPCTLYLCTKHYVEAWPVLPVALRYILWKSARKDVEIVGFDAEVDGYHVLETREQRDRLASKIFVTIEKIATDKAEIEAALERFASCLGLASSERQLYQSGAFSYMTADDLRAASLRGCAIELHGHVHDYPVGDPIAFKKDMAVCAKIIEEIGLPTPKHYCYPAGVFDDGAPDVLRSLGVISATTCVNRLASESDKKKRYYLPRFLDGENVHMLEFQAELSGFSGLIRAGLNRGPTAHRYSVRNET